jgi:hypothetical protein
MRVEVRPKGAEMKVISIITEPQMADRVCRPSPLRLAPNITSRSASFPLPGEGPLGQGALDFTHLVALRGRRKTTFSLSALEKSNLMKYYFLIEEYLLHSFLN